MKRRTIGKTSLDSGVFGLGCNRMIDAANPELVKTARAALDIGMNQFDGADAYGDGKCEEFFGKVLKDRRRDCIIVTKFGLVRQPGGTRYDGRPEYVREACERSLKRLGMETIDLYYLHFMDPNVPIEDTIGTMAALVKEGKVKHIGICNTTAELIRRAHKVHPLTAVQMEYSLMARGVEKEVLPACKDLGITFVAYGPLTYAFLAGDVKKHEDLPQGDFFRRRQSRFTDENIAANVPMLAALDEVRAAVGATRAQVSLAWCLHRPWDVLPIPGSSRMQHLQENAAAADIRLSPAQVAKLDQAFAPGRAHGDGTPVAPR